MLSGFHEFFTGYKLWCMLLLLAGEHAIDRSKQALFEKPVPQLS